MSCRLRLGNLKFGNVAFFMCDMQEKFQPIIAHFDDIVFVSKRLTEASKILDIPLIVSEQYPKGLGKTVSELDVSHAKKFFEKTQFTMCLPEIQHLIKELMIKHIILFGVETHICIQQTVIDLLEMGVEVHVISDATSSRSEVDRKFALQRFLHGGAIVTTSEAVLMQLVGGKDHPKFKEIQSLIKVSAPASGLLKY